MDELEEIKRRKLQQLQAQAAQQQDAQQMAQQAELQKALRQIDMIVKRLLTQEAQDRLANLRLVKPELVQKLKMYLAQLYVSGQVKQIDDAQLKDILTRLQQTKRESTIKRI